jgi:ribosomal protein S18 acetylase RimI-like enzyme
LYKSNDLPRLKEITAATFGPVSIDGNIDRLLGPVAGGDWQQRKLAAIDEDCRIQPDGVFVAEHPADGIVGYITTRVNLETGVGWIPNLAVDPAHQKHGLGRALIQHALADFKERGLSIARIETLEQNAAGQVLYPTLGFKEVARQIHYATRLDR